MEEAMAAMALLNLSSNEERKSVDEESLSQTKLKNEAPLHPLSKKAKKSKFPLFKDNPVKQTHKPLDTEMTFASNDNTAFSVHENRQFDQPNPFIRTTRVPKENEDSVSGNVVASEDEILRMKNSLEEAVSKQMVLYMELKEAYRKEKEAWVDNPVRLLSEEQFRSFEVTTKSLHKDVPDLIRNLETTRTEYAKFSFPGS